MQRRKFLSHATVASTAVLTTVAKSTQAQKKTPNPPEKGFLIKAGETRFGQHTPFRIVNANDLKISSKDTAGNISVFEYVGKEKVGPPLHIHFNQDEIFYVAEGEYQFQVGDEKISAKVGDTVFGPRNVPHTWIQLSEAGKLLYLVQPSGTMEQFFAALNDIKGQPTEEQIQKIHMAHGMKVLGSPMSLK